MKVSRGKGGRDGNIMGGRIWARTMIETYTAGARNGTETSLGRRKSWIVWISASRRRGVTSNRFWSDSGSTASTSGGFVEDTS